MAGGMLPELLRYRARFRFCLLCNCIGRPLAAAAFKTGNQPASSSSSSMVASSPAVLDAAKCHTKVMNFKHFAPAKNAPAAIYTDTFLYIHIYIYIRAYSYSVFANCRFIAHTHTTKSTTLFGAVGTFLEKGIKTLRTLLLNLMGEKILYS